MLHFEKSIFLQLLWLLPLWAVLWYYFQKRRRRDTELLGDTTLIEQLLPANSQNYIPRNMLWWLAGLFFLIIALANPQWGTKQTTIKRQGIDVMLLIDVSKSMLAEDATPVNRLESAKAFIRQLEQQYLSNNRLGLVVFAGTAYLQMPLSLDYNALRMFLSALQPDQMPTQGTAIAEAIDLAAENFDKDATQGKVILLFSDGEDHGEDAVAAAKNARDNNILIYTFGVGTPEGATIPEIRNGRKIGDKLDDKGQVVHTRLAEKALREVAETAGGTYYPLYAWNNNFAAIAAELDKQQKKDFESSTFNERESRYYIFTVLSVLCFLVAWRNILFPR